MAVYQTPEWHPAFEEYCEAIWELAEDDIDVIQARIAERLEVSRPAVSEMIKRLESEGLVDGDGSKISLSADGKRLAERVVRRHRLAERFLTDILQLSWAEAHQEAGRWEHVMSESVEKAMDKLLGSPTTCPHGNPIPGSEYDAPDTTPLAEIDVGSGFTVRRIPEELEFTPGLLEYLEDAAVTPGKAGSVKASSPDGTTTIEIDGNSIGIGAFASERILVSTHPLLYPPGFTVKPDPTGISALDGEVAEGAAGGAPGTVVEAAVRGDAVGSGEAHLEDVMGVVRCEQTLAAEHDDPAGRRERVLGAVERGERGAGHHRVDGREALHVDVEHGRVGHVVGDAPARPRSPARPDRPPSRGSRRTARSGRRDRLTDPGSWSARRRGWAARSARAGSGRRGRCRADRAPPGTRAPSPGSASPPASVRRARARRRCDRREGSRTPGRPRGCGRRRGRR